MPTSSRPSRPGCLTPLQACTPLFYRTPRALRRSTRSLLSRRAMPPHLDCSCSRTLPSSSLSHSVSPRRTRTLAHRPSPLYRSLMQSIPSPRPTLTRCPHTMSRGTIPLRPRLTSHSPAISRTATTQLLSATWPQSSRSILKVSVAQLAGPVAPAESCPTSAIARSPCQ